MPALLDYALVILAVAASAGYLVYRKIRSARQIARDWSTGHAEKMCDSCPAVRIQSRSGGFKPPSSTE